MYATDTEGYAGMDRRLVKFARDANVMIHDAQYLDEHYWGQLAGHPSTQGYGHSTARMACEVAASAQVQELVLFHHDPSYSDEVVARMEAFARRNFNHVQTAYEGLDIRVGTGPLSFRRKEKEELIKLEGEKYREQLIYREENGSKEMLTDYYEYEYKLKQYVSFHQKRLRFIELLRQETARYKMDPVNFNPVKALELYDDVLAIENEMLDLKQNLYLKLLRIAERKGDRDIHTWCKTMELPDHLESYFREEKSIYVWSRSYTKENYVFLSEYIRFQQFGPAALSLGSNSETRSQALALAGELYRNGIATELLVGSNTLTALPCPLLHHSSAPLLRL